MKRGAPITGWGGALYGALLAFGALLSGIVALLAALSLGAPDGQEARLREAGFVTSEDVIRAWHDHSEAGDGAAGCLLTDREVVRIEAGKVAERQALGGVAVTLQARPLAVRIGPSLVCPFQPAEGAEAFAALARAENTRAGRTSWRPVDPRVSRP